MNVSKEIIDELKAISPLLAGMEKVNIFIVPEGYFNDLHLRITDYAILNNTSAVDNITKRNLQKVPEGYFDALSSSILTKIKDFNNENAEVELNNISPVLVSLKTQNVFTVPGNYFDALSDSIADKIKTSFTENFDEELQNISPVLHSLKNENVFTVPDDYFESFAKNINKNLKPQPAKVISMNKQRSWWKYAAAAVITGIIAFSSLQMFNTSHNKNLVVASALPAYIQASFQYKTENDLNTGIAKLSDADIIKYLEKNGNVMDNELLTNNTDVSELPSQTDYLTDENTLNEYLDNIDAQNDNKLKP